MNKTYLNPDKIIQVKLDMALTKMQIMSEKISELENIISDLKVNKISDQSHSSKIQTIFNADSFGFFGQGFYSREFENGKPHRWTGQSEFTEIRIPVDRSNNRKFIINSIAPEGKKIVDTLAFVDYIQIPIQLDQNGQNVTIEGIIPHEFGSQRAVLTFWTGERWLFPPDDRLLWLAFYTLKIQDAPDDQIAKI